MALFLFLLWELPSMIIMSIHKVFCVIQGRSFEDSYLGIWAYRLIGMVVVWPTVIILIALAPQVNR